METFINQLPDYKPNQVLTEKSLNATSDFLEQQERLTRFGLTKTGIIENLEYRISNNIITIEEGFGASIDGYFMAHHYKSGPISYEFVKEYQFTEKPNGDQTFLKNLKQLPFSTIQPKIGNLKNIKFYELLSKDQVANENNYKAINELQLQSFKVVLFLEISNLDQENCSPTSCDSEGSMRRYRVVPMLVEDTEDIYFPKINSEILPKNQIRLKRFSNLFDLARTRRGEQFYEDLVNEYSRLNYHNTSALLEKLFEIKEHWDFPKSLGEKFEEMNLKRLKKAIEELSEIQVTYIPHVYIQDYPYNYGYIAQQSPVSHIPEATNLFKNKTKNPRSFKLKAKRKKESTSARVYFQAYADFCNDLEQAINELVVEYNEFTYLHFSSYTERTKRFLVLGKNDRYNHDPYRYYAIENFGNTNFREEKNIFFKHFNRVCVLIEKFKLGFEQLKFKKQIKLIPSRSGNCLLEEKAIPYYYQQDMELDQAWIVSSKKTLKTDIYQYRDLNPPYSHFVYNINSYDFVRIEGVIGQSTINFYKIPYYFGTFYQLYNLENNKQQQKMVKDLTNGVYAQATSLIKKTVNTQRQTEVKASVLKSVKSELETEMRKNYANIPHDRLTNIIEEVMVGIEKQFENKGETNNNFQLEELEKQIEFYNIPIEPIIIDINNISYLEEFKSMVEHTGGTRLGGRYIIITRTTNSGTTVVADFQVYF